MGGIAVLRGGEAEEALVLDQFVPDVVFSVQLNVRRVHYHFRAIRLQNKQTNKRLVIRAKPKLNLPKSNGFFCSGRV